MNALIGLTPTDWAETRLSDICDLIPGSPTKDDADGTIPVLKPKNLVAGRLTGEIDRMAASEARRHARYVIKSGDLLCTRTGTLGRSGLADADHVGCVFGSGLICVRVKPGTHVDPQYLASYFAHQSVSSWIIRQAKGTSIPNINAKVLGTMPVPVPPLDVQRSIAHARGALDESIAAHERIIKMTTELRDAVLPGFVSGELEADDQGDGSIRSGESV